MAATSTSIELLVNDEAIAGTLLAPEPRMPGILFVHGWGGSQERDMRRGRHIAGLGCVCLTFDLRGHEKTQLQKQTVTRAHNLEDMLVAYDHLVRHPATDPQRIAVIGTSCSGYLGPFSPPCARYAGWPCAYRRSTGTTMGCTQTATESRQVMDYRQTLLGPRDNQALAACSTFTGDVLIVESERDEHVPTPPS